MGARTPASRVYSATWPIPHLATFCFCRCSVICPKHSTATRLYPAPPSDVGFRKHSMHINSNVRSSTSRRQSATTARSKSDLPCHKFWCARRQRVTAFRSADVYVVDASPTPAAAPNKSPASPESLLLPLPSPTPPPATAAGPVAPSPRAVLPTATSMMCSPLAAWCRRIHEGLSSPCMTPPTMASR